MVRKDILKDKIMSNAILETETTFHNETQIYGAPKDFNLPAIPEKIIDVEYTEIDSHKQIANDNSTDNNPTPPTSTALIPVGNTYEAVTVPATPENLITFIEINEEIAKAAFKLAQKNALTKENMDKLYQRAWKHAAIVFEAQARLGKFFKTIDTAQGSRTDLSNQLPGKAEKKLTKEEFIKTNWKYDTKKAWELEQLANDKLKEKTYKYARENEEYPSLKLALKIRKMEKDLLSAMTSSNTQTQAKHEANQNKLKEKALQDAIKFSKLTRKNATVLSDKTFDVVYADFSNVTTPLEDLSQLSIPANDNSVLLAWTDNKNLSKILCLVQNLGFEYQESLVWNYMASSVGKFIKNQHKQLLICTKGYGLKSEYQEASVLNLHKNEEVDAKNHYYALIEQMFPEGAYLDMFASEKHNSKWSLYSETTNNAAIEEN